MLARLELPATPDFDFPPGAPVPSPCVLVCKLDEQTGWCGGCLRTGDEIAAWPELADEAKRAIWAELRARRDFVG